MMVVCFIISNFLETDKKEMRERQKAARKEKKMKEKEKEEKKRKRKMGEDDEMDVRIGGDSDEVSQYE